MRALRTIAWGLVAALAITIAGVAALRFAGTGPLPGAVQVGGPFELTRADGTRFSSAQLKGSAHAIFFGFTHCPDVCPTKLNDLTNLLADLKGNADRLKVLFVSLDPERDTPKLLAEYLGAFDRRIIGLTGTPAEIERVAKAYRIFYKKVATTDSYTLDHTALVLVFDRSGSLASTLSPEEAADVHLRKLEMAVSR